MTRNRLLTAWFVLPQTGLLPFAAGIRATPALAADPRTANKPASVTANGMVTDGLVLFHDYAEGSGNTAFDGTQYGNDGALVGNCSWGDGYVRVNPDTSSEGWIYVSPSSSLQASTYTVEMWIRVIDRLYYGRIIRYLEPTCMESLCFDGTHLGHRVYNNGNQIVWNTPNVGYLSTPEPPDHLAVTADAFVQGAASPYHFVWMHDPGQRKFWCFMGQEGDPLKLSLEATYKTSYGSAGSALCLGNAQGGSRPTKCEVYQFAVYNRALTFTVDGSLNVTAGELLQQHQLGSDMSLRILITEHPDDVEVRPGHSATFSVSAVGADLSYQWQKDTIDLTDGGHISGAATDTLQIDNVDSGDVGSYRCVVSNAYDSVISNEATLTLNMLAPADFDRDGDVDQDDFGHFQACYSGPGGAVEPVCQDADLNSDDDVDQNDFGLFQACMSGPNIPADPNCAE